MTVGENLNFEKLEHHSTEVEARGYVAIVSETQPWVGEGDSSQFSVASQNCV